MNLMTGDRAKIVVGIMGQFAGVVARLYTDDRRLGDLLIDQFPDMEEFVKDQASISKEELRRWVVAVAKFTVQTLEGR